MHLIFSAKAYIHIIYIKAIREVGCVGCHVIPKKSLRLKKYNRKKKTKPLASRLLSNKSLPVKSQPKPISSLNPNNSYNLKSNHSYEIWILGGCLL